VCHVLKPTDRVAHEEPPSGAPGGSIAAIAVVDEGMGSSSSFSCCSYPHDWQGAPRSQRRQPLADARCGASLPAATKAVARARTASQRQPFAPRWPFPPPPLRGSPVFCPGVRTEEGNQKPSTIGREKEYIAGQLLFASLSSRRVSSSPSAAQSGPVHQAPTPFHYGHHFLQDLPLHLRVRLRGPPWYGRAPLVSRILLRAHSNLKERMDR
jgi:hypothetical protein